MTPTPVERASVARRLGAGVGWALVLGLLVLIWPGSLGGCTTLTVITGHSMEPTLQPGDFAVLRCGEPEVGDVIAYRPFPEQRALVIHRVIGGDGGSGWELQGDNNDFIDPFYPVAEQVQGALVFSVPRIGAALGMLGLPWVWGSAFVVAAGLLWFRSRQEPSDADVDVEPDVDPGAGAPALVEREEQLEPAGV